MERPSTKFVSGTPIVSRRVLCRTGPVGPGHRVIMAEGVACAPCRVRDCKSPRYLECMERISVREVADAAVSMLQEGRTGAV